MHADSPNAIPVGRPLEEQNSTPGFVFTEIAPNKLENPALLENACISLPMPMLQLIKPKEAPKPKKREWCCNEIVILLCALWICGVIFIFALNCSNREKNKHNQETANEKMIHNISLAVMGVVVLFFFALLTTTRLIYPDGKVATYLVQEKKCMIGVLNFLIMLTILANILLINFLSRHYGDVHHRLALMYVFMSCIPKIIARLELNFPVCLLMIVFEVTMAFFISYIRDDHEHLSIPFYIW
jgi:hypothetical protein